MDLKLQLILADIKCDRLNVGKPMVRPLVSSRFYAIPEFNLLWFFGGRWAFRLRGRHLVGYPRSEEGDGV